MLVADEEPVEELDRCEVAAWLVDERRRIERAEPAWLEALAGFDRAEGWANDAQHSCAGWLVWRCGMARSTAYEKLRIAHQLRRRPIVREAFGAGQISYSATRLITSLDDPDADVDRALVELARGGHLHYLERAVRYYQCLEDQELGRGQHRREHREVVVYKGFDGLGILRAKLTNAELDQVEAVLRAFLEPDEPSAAADSSPAGSSPAGSSPVGIAGGPFDDALTVGPDPDVSAAADSSTEDGATYVDDWWVPYRRRRADALMDAMSVALGGAHDGRAAGADRYMVHVVADASTLAEDGLGRCEVVDGSPIDRGELGRICCDASVVGHIVRNGTEPLAIGRRSRVWTAAQRRAISVRDAGRCRFPGCQRRITDVHHLIPWEQGGPTEVANGALVCTRHHTLVHSGFRAEGDANGTLTFFLPYGVELGRTTPPGALPVTSAA